MSVFSIGIQLVLIKNSYAMKRNLQLITLLFTLVFAVNTTNAQVIFEEDFETYNYDPENGDIIDLENGGWTLYDEDGDGENWYVEPTSSFTKVAQSRSYLDGALTPENWLVSPAINLADFTGETIQLDFVVFAWSEDYFAEKYKVVVSKTDNLVASFLDEDIVHEQTLTAENYDPTTVEIDISDYAGETIYIAFVHYDCTNQSRLNIDDISVKALEHFEVTFGVANNQWGSLAVTVNETDATSGDIFIESTEILFTANPDEGYQVKEWKINDEVVMNDDVIVTDLSWTYELDKDIDVSVEFEEEDPTSTSKQLLSNISVYPNPFSNFIEVSNEQHISRVVITNLIGQVVFDEPMTQTRLNTSNLSNGVYLVVFQTNNGERIVRKMVKQ